jgi:hypothetical protein
MMIDVEHRRSIQPDDAGTIEGTALHDERAIVGRRHFRREMDVLDVRKGLEEVRGRRVHDDLSALADRTKRQRHTDGRSDRVAIRPLVRGQDEASALAKVD